jgi:hypothetical protein
LSSAQLKTSEFAYLLALLNAPNVVGLEDSALFPTKSSTRDATYSQGREELEKNGWLKPVPDYPDEYELNPLLLEMVSAIATPEFIVDTSHSTGESEFRQVLHYVVDDSIVEISAPAEGTYQVGSVPDHETLYARMAEMLCLTTTRQTLQFTLDETAFEDIQSLSKEGHSKEAVKLLDSTDVDSKNGQSFIDALVGSTTGQIVVVSLDSGQVTSGRRASVFGEGDSAWLVKRRVRISSELDIAHCDSTSIGALINEWIDELSDQRRLGRK